jgi:hypothetical protein
MIGGHSFQIYRVDGDLDIWIGDRRYELEPFSPKPVGRRPAGALPRPSRLLDPLQEVVPYRARLKHCHQSDIPGRWRITQSR